MGNVTSTLTMRLVDRVSGVAGKVKTAIAGVDIAAKKAVGLKGGLQAISSASTSALLASGGQLITAAAGYATATTVAKGYKDMAAMERRLTRIMHTAGGTRGELAGVRDQIFRIADETALPIDDVMTGMESLVASGKSIPEALSFLPSVARTAQAAGAAVRDMSTSSDALAVSMGISAKEMQTAFDMMVKAGNEGKFEGKDMAEAMPSILPLAASKGFKGLEGFKRIAAYLQVIRQGTGSSAEAADSFRDMLGKITSTETVNKFKKFGIDAQKEMRKVRETGGNEFERMAELIQQAMKKGAVITDLFQDVQAARGWLAFTQGMAQIPGLLARIGDSAGTVKKQLGDVTKDPAAGIQRLSSAWEKFLLSVGKAADAGGGSSFLDWMAGGAEQAAKDLQKLADILDKIKQGKFGEAAEAAALLIGGQDKPGIPAVQDLDADTRKESAAQLPRILSELEQSKIARDALLKMPNRSGKDNAWLEVLNRQIQEAEQKATEHVLSLLPRPPKLLEPNPLNEKDIVRDGRFHEARAEQARREAARKAESFHGARARQARERRTDIAPLDDATPWGGVDHPLTRAPAIPGRLAEIGASITDSLDSLRTKLNIAFQGIPIVPDERSQAQRFPPGPDLGQRFPPTPSYETGGGFGSDASGKFTEMQIGANGDAAIAEAERVAAQVKSIIESNPPVIRPRVEMPSIPSIPGGRVRGNTARSHSDDGGRR